MKKAITIVSIFLLVLILTGTGCANRTASAQPVPDDNNRITPGLPLQLTSTIFVQNTDGTDDGVKKLIGSMQSHGINFYDLITPNDVVILKIIC